MFGYFSGKLSKSEREYFIDCIEEYRRGGTPFCTMLKLIKGFAVRFEEDYLLSQWILSPYPEKLFLMNDSGKGRSL
jgi:uncharacterized protein YbgA (DUF1722 family)